MKTLVIAIFAVVLALGFSLPQAARAQPEGEQIYSQNCAPCHGSQGEGEFGPALAGNNDLADARQMVLTILNGRGAMPAWGPRLSDEQIAAVATHERNSWGNSFGEISPDMVAELRQQSGQGQGLPQEEGIQKEQGQQTGGGAQGGQQTQVATVQVAQNDAVGAHLVTASGRTLYRFVNDAPEGVTHCYEPCSTHWPPLLTQGKPQAGNSLDASLLGTVKRDDGTTQVTYNGWPLYGYVGGQGTGAAKGTAVSDLFLVVPPDIGAITAAQGGRQKQGQEQQEKQQQQAAQQGQQEQELAQTRLQELTNLANRLSQLREDLEAGGDKEQAAQEISDMQDEVQQALEAGEGEYQDVLEQLKDQLKALHDAVRQGDADQAAETFNQIFVTLQPFRAQ